MYSIPISSLADSDYIPVVLERLTFSIGSVNGNRDCINITIVDDETFERDETFSLTIAAAEDSISIRPHFSSSILILDDEGNLIL